MNIEVVIVSVEEKHTLNNLVKMYCYEWSQYNKFDVNDRGEYQFEQHLFKFWEKESHYPFFIKVNEKLAGFVLVNNGFELYPDSDYSISEFFVMYKYRRGGVGRYVAKVIFDIFRGKWEIVRHPHNAGSVRFLDSVVKEYTDGKYAITKSCKDVVYNDGTLGDEISFKN